MGTEQTKSSGFNFWQNEPNSRSSSSMRMEAGPASGSTIESTRGQVHGRPFRWTDPLSRMSYSAAVPARACGRCPAKIVPLIGELSTFEQVLDRMTCEGLFATRPLQRPVVVNDAADPLRAVAGLYESGQTVIQPESRD
jgi:hypothetical protein